MGSRTLGLDVGDRWIGVAISDPTGLLATPLTVIQRTTERADVDAVAETIRERPVERVIVGLPRSLNGRVGQQAAKVQQFAGALAARLSVPLEFRDERLSTVSAQRLMREAGTKKGKRKVRDDAAAAAVILQSYLDETRDATR